MDQRISWTARCAYPGRDAFLFHSPSFTVASWDDLDAAAKASVSEAWSKISPHPAPPVVELIPGMMCFQPSPQE